MNFKIKRIKLLNALSKTTKAVSIRSPLPVLTGIKFDLHDDCLILTGSDSDITIQTKIIKDEEDNDMFELIDNEVELAAVEEAYNTIFMEEE